MTKKKPEEEKVDFEEFLAQLDEKDEAFEKIVQELLEEYGIADETDSQEKEKDVT